MAPVIAGLVQELYPYFQPQVLYGYIYVGGLCSFGNFIFPVRTISDISLVLSHTQASKSFSHRQTLICGYRPVTSFRLTNCTERVDLALPLLSSYR